MISLRPATVEDVALLARMIRELAEYERESDSVQTSEEQLARDGFGSRPLFQALIAECDGQPAGYALYFDFYSSWRGRMLFLEDLFVRPQFRGRKIGLGMMSELARVAERNQCCGMRWEVLGWNQSAIELYRALGGEFLDDWKLVLLDRPAQRQLGLRMPRELSA